MPRCVITEARLDPVGRLDDTVGVAVLEADALEQPGAGEIGDSGMFGENHGRLPGVIGPQTGTASPRNTVCANSSRSTACERAWRNSRF